MPKGGKKVTKSLQKRAESDKKKKKKEKKMALNCSKWLQILEIAWNGSKSVTAFQPKGQKMPKKVRWFFLRAKSANITPSPPKKK